MKFEYFDLNGRGYPIRLLLKYANVDFEDARITMEAFGANKAAGKYTYGQVPALFLDDGTQLCQT